MGVTGLWDVLRPAGEARSLTHLAVVDGFEKNPDGIRGFRIGIDASIWFFHASYGKEGENPQLRTLFFRCATLMRAPFLPLFVFDGPKRPSVKRGKRVSGNAHWLTTGMKNIIEAFGFEWRTAPGEAEAELAYLNRIGIIDGVLSDDVDNFLFGATVVIRNSSNTLSGNRAHPIKNSAGKDDKNHSIIYRLKDISARPDVSLTRGGLILIGLLSGGDYHQAGLPRCGTKIAHALAKCGFGDTLYQAAFNYSRHELPHYLSVWREELRQELRTNSQGHQRGKNVALAMCVPDDFPDIDILLSYTNPITSETEGRAQDYLKIAWAKEPDLGKLANICELYFEWGVKPIIIKRFRTVIWPSAVLRILRRAALDADYASEGNCPSTPKKNGKQRADPIGTPSKLLMTNFSSMQSHSLSRDVSDQEGDDALIVKIHSTRTHASTDGLLEYRLEIAPAPLVRLSEAGVTGIRPPIADDEWVEEKEDDEDGNRKGQKSTPVVPLSHLRMWMPASMVRIVEPGLVDKFEGIQERNRQKKAGVAARKAGSKSKAISASFETMDPAASGCEDAPKRKEIVRRSKAVKKTSSSVAKPVAIMKEDEGSLSSGDDNWSNFKAVVANTAVQQDMKSYFTVGKNTANSLAIKNSKVKPGRLTKAAATKPIPPAPTIIELSDFDDLPSPGPPQTPSVITAPKSFTAISQTANFRDIFPTFLSSDDAEELAVSKHTQPNPFPISLENTIRGQADKFFAESSRSRPSTPTPKHTRKKVQLTTESDSYEEGLKKSPRKSATHNSPRSKDPLISPSLTQFRVTVSSSEPVIEISSDSDALPSKPNTRAKKLQHKTTSSQKDPKVSVKTKVAVQVDIIDLT